MPEELHEVRLEVNGATHVVEVVALERSYQQLLGALTATQVTARVVAAGWMLEELRVSLFAQALGTKVAVSPRRVASELEALWSGDPYPDVDVESVSLERDRLVELRLTLHELRGQALLDLGRPEAAVLALAAVAPHHPFRERIWALLALAQYR